MPKRIGKPNPYSRFSRVPAPYATRLLNQHFLLRPTMSDRKPLPPDLNAHAVALYIAGWYFFSVSISIYNKWMFGNGLDFKFPLFVTAFHQLCLLLLSGLVLYFRPSLRPTINSQNAIQDFLPSLKMAPLLYLRHIVPCALASAGDIGLSNLSFRYISLSLYTMLKTSSLIFVLFFGLIFRLESFNWRLVVIVLIMSVSVVMMTKDSTSAASAEPNHPVGIVLVLSAAMVSGLRWSFTQLLLKKNDYTRNPILTIFYISPAMICFLLATALSVERWSRFVTSPIWDAYGVAAVFVLMVLPGFLAFMMTLCEFKLLSVAQVLTLSVAGIFKELITILLGLLIFGDSLSLLNCIGLVITFLDILWYNYYRFRQSDQNDPSASYTPLNDPPDDAIALESGASSQFKQH